MYLYQIIEARTVTVHMLARVGHSASLGNRILLNTAPATPNMTGCIRYRANEASPILFPNLPKRVFKKGALSASAEIRPITTSDEAADSVQTRNRPEMPYP